MSRVTSLNPFDLLTDENEDRTNVPTPKKEQKPAAATSKPAAKPAATSAKPAAKQDTKAPAKPADTKAAPKPTGNSANQTVKPAPARDANQSLQERDKEVRAPRDKKDRPRNVGEGKRAFDKHSGTGRVKNEQSRGGRGRGNWGEADVNVKEGTEALKDKEEKLEEDKVEGQTNEDKVTVEGDKKEGAAKEGEATDAAPKDEPTFTLDEHLERMKSRAIPQVEALKPRTVTDSDFGAAGLVPLARETLESPLNAKEKKDKKPAAEKPAAAATTATDKAAAEKKKEKDLAAQLLTFATHSDFKRQERAQFRRENYGDDRRDDRNRGGDRKGRNPNATSSPNTRAPRTDSKQAAAGQPPVQEKDFPTLGPHGSAPVKTN